MAHRGSMDLKNMLNEDEGDSTSRLSQQPSQTPHNLPPPMPPLQTSRSSHTPGTFTQGSPIGSASYSHPPYGPPPYLERRSSSHQSQYSSMPAGTPTTPHTPGSGISYPPPRQYSQPQHYQQSPFHHPPSATPSNRHDTLHHASLYTPSPQTYLSSSANHFGPALRESPSQMPPPRESPSSWGSRQTSITPGQTPTTIHASAPQYPPQRTVHPESPLVTNGRSSLSVSPKTKPLPILKESYEPSNSREHSHRQEETSVARVNPETQYRAPTEVAPEQTSVNQQASRQSPLPQSAVIERETTPQIASRGTKRERPSTSAGTPPDPATSAPETKKRRPNEIPIWAQPAKGVRLLAKYKTSQAANITKEPIQPPANGKLSANHPSSTPAAPTVQQKFGDDGPLGVFEQSIHGDFIPSEDCTKAVCDWIFQQAVYQNPFKPARVGEAAAVEGQIEIEAKVGTITHSDKRDRIALPVTTEAVLAPAFRDIGFESMMTLEQHKVFNEYLNNAAKDSIKPPPPSNNPSKPRIQIKYEHKREVDSFYPLPPSEFAALPAPVQKIVQNAPGRQPRIRVTRDQKTGAVLAKMIKARIADLHVYSPRTVFDYRISINIEARWDGDLDALMREMADHPPAKREPDRYKDRMSYTHRFNQIDLTQVRPAANAGTADASHELEVELDSAAVREQGQKLLKGEPQLYMELIKSFLDNVRILVRAVTPK